MSNFSGFLRPWKGSNSVRNLDFFSFKPTLPLGKWIEWIDKHKQESVNIRTNIKQESVNTGSCITRRILEINIYIVQQEMPRRRIIDNNVENLSFVSKNTILCDGSTWSFWSLISICFLTFKDKIRVILTQTFPLPFSGSSCTSIFCLQEEDKKIKCIRSFGSLLHFL